MNCIPTNKQQRMSEILNKLALSQVVMLLRDTMKKDKSMSGIELPEDMSDRMYQTMCEQTGEPMLVSVRDVMPCRIPLPFMPNRIDYKIGKGCCDEIVTRNGLFVPCSHHCEEGDKCKIHTKEASGLGTYWDRYAAWEKKELYCVVIKEKEVKEKTYGAYLHSKNLDAVAVAEELKKWGIPLKLDAALCRPPPKPMKKNRGRKAVRKVGSAESDEDSGSNDSGDEPELDESEALRGVALDTTEAEPEKEKTVEQDEELDSPSETESDAPSESVPAVEAPVEKKKERPPPKQKKEKTEKTEKKEKTKKIVKGTPLDAEPKAEPTAELKKEEMEEKTPKKGKFRGNKESLKEIEHEGTAYLTKDGKYYNKDTLHLIAWTKNGEFTML